MVKRTAPLEHVLLMDNVSPLWRWQAGRMYLHCVVQSQAEHLRKWGGLQFAEHSVYVSQAYKKVMEIKLRVKFQSLCLTSWSLLVESFAQKSKRLFFFIGTKANVTFAGAIHTPGNFLSE